MAGEKRYAGAQPVSHPEFNDILVGSSAIAKHLGVAHRRARSLIEADALPVFKMGGSVCARRSVLNDWLAAIEAKGRKADQPA